MSVSVPISIVVCTHNRIDRLRRCVEALFSIRSNRRWELVIVDNASNDGTSALLASFPSQLGNVDIITTFESARGSGAARNKGFANTRGDIVAFIDDDCYVAEDYFDATLSAFDGKPEIGFVSGRMLLFDKSDL